jgi:hypothetical protein
VASGDAVQSAVASVGAGAGDGLGSSSLSVLNRGEKGELLLILFLYAARGI